MNTKILSHGHIQRQSSTDGPYDISHAGIQKRCYIHQVIYPTTTDYVSMTVSIAIANYCLWGLWTYLVILSYKQHFAWLSETLVTTVKAVSPSLFYICARKSPCTCFSIYICSLLGFQWEISKVIVQIVDVHIYLLYTCIILYVQWIECCMMTSSNGKKMFALLVPSAAQRPVTRSFDVFSDLRLNKQLSKQSRCWWNETPSHPFWRHCHE